MRSLGSLSRSGGVLCMATGLWGWISADTAITDAARRGDAEAVRSLLRGGADVNASEGDGMTALHWAADAGHIEIAHILLYAGANVEAAIRRAVKHADGWTGAGSSVLAVLATNIALVQELLDADGRTQADFPISKRMYLAVDDDEARALRRLQEWSGYYYGNAEIPERSAIWGSPARIQEKLAEMAEMGVNEFVLNPVFDYEEQMEQLARITGLV